MVPAWAFARRNGGNGSVSVKEFDELRAQALARLSEVQSEIADLRVTIADLRGLDEDERKAREGTHLEAHVLAVENLQREFRKRLEGRADAIEGHLTNLRRRLDAIERPRPEASMMSNAMFVVLVFLAAGAYPDHVDQLLRLIGIR